ncbi:MAG TPA: aminotransferase class III-fold pyridoxal phosphate-dependent enzyme [Acidimicrobiales bacterium]|nr:aminotransferase class III-fold pyridoxal phosphate-dependent enzyme [Acidimicrobiales bacterium]
MGDPTREHEYGITDWPDIDDIVKRCDALVATPPRPLRRDRMEAYLSWFDTHCAGSKAAADEAQQVIPGGVQHNLAFNHPFALAVEKAEGAYLWDVDGNRYIDFLQAGGPTVLGSNYAPVREKVIELLQTCGPVTGLFHDYELKLARLIHDFMPAVEQFRMLGSGTESVMAALRAARAYTGHEHVVKVGGGYHGWSDQVVYALRLPGTGALDATGIPPDNLARTHEFFPHDVDELRSVLEANRDKGGTAALIVEPVGPESGVRPVPYDFAAQARELCDEFGALLIFDEVVTGFRLGLGGAQGYFGVRPDLTVFGKCVAGGYPAAGGVGGSQDVMSVFAGGLSSKGVKVLVGGTLSANPLSCAAGYHSLLEMERTGAPVLAGRAGDRLRAGLEQLIGRYDLPYVTYNFGSIVHLHTSGVLQLDLRDPAAFGEVGPRRHMLEEMGAAFAAEGMITLAGSRLYTSMADTDEVVDDALSRFDRVFSGVG